MTNQLKPKLENTRAAEQLRESREQTMLMRKALIVAVISVALTAIGVFSGVLSALWSWLPTLFDFLSSLFPFALRFLLAETLFPIGLLILGGLTLIMLAYAVFTESKEKYSISRERDSQQQKAEEFEQTVKALQRESNGRLGEVIKSNEQRDRYAQQLQQMTDEVLRLQNRQNPTVHTSAIPLVDANLVESARNVLNTWSTNLVEKVLYFDTDYPASFVDNQDASRDHFAAHGFTVLNASALRDFMLEAIRTRRSHQTMVVVTQGVMPVTVMIAVNKTSTMRRYLDTGGRIVWRGDVPLYYRGQPGAETERIDVVGASNVLEVDFFNYFTDDANSNSGRIWDGRFPLALTTAGTAAGLVERQLSARVIPTDNNTVVYSQTARPINLFRVPGEAPRTVMCAAAWKKTFNPDYPHSGFMQYYLYNWDASDVRELEAYLRFAVSGWPLIYVNLT